MTLKLKWMLIVEFTNNYHIIPFKIVHTSRVKIVFGFLVRFHLIQLFEDSCKINVIINRAYNHHQGAVAFTHMQVLMT